MQLAPLICVDDVETSSRWYQALLGWSSGHGGRNYERLLADGRLMLQLHRWDVDHQHGPLGDPSLPHGNGVVLWLELAGFDEAAAQADRMGVSVLRPRRFSENGNWELWLRDPDGYTVVLTSPLPPAPAAGS